MSGPTPSGLQRLDTTLVKPFEDPIKKINDHDDVNFFLTSKAYTDIVTFILQLNASLFPKKSLDPHKPPQTWKLGSEAIPHTSVTERLSEILSVLQALIDQAPPDPGPRRFGNVAFRQWYSLVEQNIDTLLAKYLPTLDIEPSLGAVKELKVYLLGSFGSAQRLDYGTGHELSFLAFLAGLWKLGGVSSKNEAGKQERAVVVHVVEPYLNLIRNLIKTYTLEPAGTHGVWGLDDHSFVPYIFGSAQLGPPISNVLDVPQEGSLPGAPDPGDVVKAPLVDHERKVNMYFSAIGFIYDVKKGPFWEHSPMLYDISGIRAGWAKINKGMIKMYIAEVLSKFPVVQHFPFGQIFAWERDPNAPIPTQAPNSSSTAQGADHAATSVAGLRAPLGKDTLSSMPSGTTRGASKQSDEKSKTMPNSSMGRAPWANPQGAPVANPADPMVPTRAPWAREP